MSAKPKLLFDECIGWPAVESLRILLGVTDDVVELGHAVKMGFGGQKDEEWIPAIANQGWTIVTGDRGARRKPQRGQKLSEVCREHRISYVLLSRSVNAATSHQKIKAIMSVWDALLEVHKAAGGSEFVLRPTPTGAYTLVCTLVCTFDAAQLPPRGDAEQS